MIKNIVFDLGGVIITLDAERPLRLFEKLGVRNAAEYLNTYEQRGPFLELEAGKIDWKTFCNKVEALVGKPLREEDLRDGWLGFLSDVPQYKLDYILELRKRYKVLLLSNTNPAVMGWARTSAFSAKGLPINDYFDKIYASYEVGITKPNPEIFRYMASDADIIPEETIFIDDGERNISTARTLGFVTLQPKNGEDWRNALQMLL
jgi:putative hydrolase of the HAD superfamily